MDRKIECVERKEVSFYTVKADGKVVGFAIGDNNKEYYFVPDWEYEKAIKARKMEETPNEKYLKEKIDKYLDLFD